MKSLFFNKLGAVLLQNFVWKASRKRRTYYHELSKTAYIYNRTEHSDVLGSVWEGALREIFGPERDGLKGNGRNYITRSFMISSAHQLSSRWSNQEEWSILHTPTGKRKVSYSYLVGKGEEKRPLRRAGNRWMDNIKIDLK